MRGRGGSRDWKKRLLAGSQPLAGLDPPPERGGGMGFALRKALAAPHRIRQLGGHGEPHGGHPPQQLLPAGGTAAGLVGQGIGGLSGGEFEM